MRAVKDYSALAQGAAHCDYSFHTIVTDPNETVMKVEIPQMVAFGITSIKVS
jgi:dihydropyrimidinase